MFLISMTLEKSVEYGKSIILTCKETNFDRAIEKYEKLKEKFENVSIKQIYPLDAKEYQEKQNNFIHDMEDQGLI